MLPNRLKNYCLEIRNQQKIKKLETIEILKIIKTKTLLCKVQRETEQLEHGPMRLHPTAKLLIKFTNLISYVRKSKHKIIINVKKNLAW